MVSVAPPPYQLARANEKEKEEEKEKPSLALRQLVSLSTLSRTADNQRSDAPPVITLPPPETPANRSAVSSAECHFPPLSFTLIEDKTSNQES